MATDLQFDLYQKPFDSHDQEFLATLIVRGSNEFQSETQSLNLVVDSINTQYAVLVRPVNGPWPGSSDLAVHGVRIKWKP